MRNYRETKKRSAIPVWGFGAVWLVWCLFGPMYRPWHLVLCAALSHLTRKAADMRSENDLTI